MLMWSFVVGVPLQPRHSSLALPLFPPAAGEEIVGGQAETAGQGEQKADEIRAQKQEPHAGTAQARRVHRNTAARTTPQQESAAVKPVPVDTSSATEPSPLPSPVPMALSNCDLNCDPRWETCAPCCEDFCHKVHSCCCATPTWALATLVEPL